MKKLNLIFAAMAVFVFVNSKTQAQNCVEQGTVIFDAFYGYPYYNGVLLKALVNNANNVRNTNHLGGKVEFMVTDKIGLGVEATYADVSANYSYTDSLNQTYSGKAGINKLRVLGKLNVHFATTEHIDPYFTVGAGVKRTSYYDSGSQFTWSGNLIPVAVRVGVGFRYFFSDAVGVNAEVGLGGPLAQAGLSFKF